MKTTRSLPLAALLALLVCALGQLAEAQPPLPHASARRNEAARPGQQGNRSARPLSLATTTAAARPAGAKPAPAQRNLELSLGRHVDYLAMRHIYLPHYQAKNVRWGFWGSGRKVREGLQQAETRLHRVLQQLESRGTLTVDQQQALSASLSQRLNEHFGRTTGVSLREQLPFSQSKRFPDALPLQAGSGRWWRWLQRATKVTVTPYSHIDLLIDGPHWRRANQRLVQKAQGFLHIASWGLHYDEQGRWFALQLIARKLKMSPRQLARELKSQSLEQIRDHRLAQQLAKVEHLSRDDAKQQVAALDEAGRRALVGKLLEPLEVRVLLGSLIQNVSMRREQLLKTGELRHVLLEDLRKAGVEVALDKKLISRANLGIRPENLWAVVPHSKLTISGDEALTGGMNFGNHYLQPRMKELDWHDAAVRVKGELAAELNDSFVARWNKLMASDGTPERAIAAAPSGLATKDKPSQALQRTTGRAMVVGTDNQASDKTTYSYRTSLMMALAGARESFSMVVPYLTSPLLVKQLVRTAERFRAEGRDPAKIEVTISGSTDTPLTGKFVTGHLIHLLQQAGVTVRYWHPDPKASPYLADAVHHAKAWIADGKVAYLGSANGTVRSLVQDWELGLLINDPTFIAKLQSELFQRDRQFLVPPAPRSALQRAAGHAVALLFGPIFRLL